MPRMDLLIFLLLDLKEKTRKRKSFKKKWLRQLERPKIFSRLKLFPIRKI